MSGKRRKRDIIEIGSGDCSKISIILEAIPPADRPTVTYVPVDVSRSAIKDSAYKLLERFPSLRIAGVLADFRTQLHRITSSREKLFCFFGSTIGNLSGSEAVSCLREIRKAMRRGDALLLGIDMVKPREVLERAYNDSRGITAEFNRNILKVSNRLAGTDFDPADFDHVAFYNSELGRIEMHLRACKRTKVSCPFAGEDITLKDGETIHTENSRKFTGPGVDELLEGAGLMRKRTYGDPDGWFSLIEVVRK
jgi:L-histidine N-alpha-methyltransferase